jgi:hypothetical protein
MTVSAAFSAASPGLFLKGFSLPVASGQLLVLSEMRKGQCITMVAKQKAQKVSSELLQSL